MVFIYGQHLSEWHWTPADSHRMGQWRLHASGPGTEGQRRYHFWRYLSSSLVYSLRFITWTSCLTFFLFLYILHLNKTIIPWYQFLQHRNIPTGHYSEGKEFYLSSPNHSFWVSVIQVAALKGVKKLFLLGHSCAFLLLHKHFLKDERQKKSRCWNQIPSAFLDLSPCSSLRLNKTYWVL